MKRQRFNRLLSVLSGSREKFGIGVDEDVGVALIDNCQAEVLGSIDKKVVFIEKTGDSTDNDSFKIHVYKSGCKFFIPNEMNV